MGTKKGESLEGVLGAGHHGVTDQTGSFPFTGIMHREPGGHGQGGGG